MLSDPARSQASPQQADLWRGTGSAAFLIAQPLMLLGMTPVAAVRATFAIAILLGGLGMYVWLRDRWGDRAAGLAGYAVHAVATVAGDCVRAGQPERCRLCWPATAGLCRRRHLSPSTAAPAPSLWSQSACCGCGARRPGWPAAATLLLLAYALIVERSWLAAVVVGLSAGAGFTSLLPLWSIQAASPVAFFDHFVYPHQLFFGSWIVAPSVAGWQDRYPFQLGFVTLTFGIAALWLWFTQRQEWRGTVHGAGVGVLCSRRVAADLNEHCLSAVHSGDSPAPTGCSRIRGRSCYLPDRCFAAVAGSLPVTAPRPGQAAAVDGVGRSHCAGQPAVSDDRVHAGGAARCAACAYLATRRDIVLLDAKLTEDAEAQEAELAVTWQALQPLPFDYNVFFQALAAAPDGQPRSWRNWTRSPCYGERPATTWTAGRDIHRYVHAGSFADRVCPLRRRNQDCATILAITTGETARGCRSTAASTTS